MTVERIQGPAADEDTWWTNLPAAPATKPDPWYTEEDGQRCMDELTSLLERIDSATTESGTTVPNAARWMADNLHLEEMVATVVLIQEARKRLQDAEAYLTRQVALTTVEVSGPKDGVLADGRPWTLRRGNTRKAWDHDAWKRDARAAVVDAVAARYVNTDTLEREEAVELVDATTGEYATLAHVLQVAVSQAQEVAGSTAPRVTKLRELGLDPDDYTESIPGTWTIQALAPAATTEGD